MSNGNMISITNYPQRTVAGMYKQEKELAKADEAGLILTAADLEEQNCELCGDKRYLIHDEFLCPNCDQDVLE